jgi:hypothetical protein
MPKIEKLLKHLVRTPIFLTVTTLAGVTDITPAAADVKCVRAANKVVNGKVVTSLSQVTRSSTCKKGEVKALTGPRGQSGPTGADGQLRIYGDGSDGAKSVATNQTLSDPAPMYTDVVIESGMTWTVPSGAVIRCTGTFQNNGTIVVQTGAPGGDVVGADTSSLTLAYSPPHPGISARAAASGEFGDGTSSRAGGRGGIGLSLFQASMLRYPGAFAGGGGAGGSTEGGVEVAASLFSATEGSRMRA